MAGRSRVVRQIRVDIPLKTAFMYMFVDRFLPEQDPWWDRLFEFLLTFRPADSEWQLHPLRDSAVVQPHLSESQRSEIASFIRAAPKNAVDTNRTLRRAVNMTNEQEQRLELMYFSADIVGLSS